MADSVMVKGDFLKKLSRHRICRWVQKHSDKLVGGGVFTIGNTPIVPLIRNFSKKYAHSDFVPSHVGSIIKLGGLYYIFNMTPPKASFIELVDYIAETKEDFRIVFGGENYKIDEKEFSYNLFCKIGQKYGYFSALQCIFPHRDLIPNRKEHCSEIHVKALQRFGFFDGVNGDDMTPVEVYDKMLEGDF